MILEDLPKVLVDYLDKGEFPLNDGIILVAFDNRDKLDAAIRRVQNDVLFGANWTYKAGRQSFVHRYGAVIRFRFLDESTELTVLRGMVFDEIFWIGHFNPKIHWIADGRLKKPLLKNSVEARVENRASTVLAWCKIVKAAFREGNSSEDADQVADSLRALDLLTKMATLGVLAVEMEQQVATLKPMELG